MTMIHSASDVTGSTAILATDKVEHFNKYEITVRLGPSKEFLGIVQVAVQKDFLSLTQRVASNDSLNASDFYE